MAPETWGHLGRAGVAKIGSVEWMGRRGIAECSPGHVEVVLWRSGAAGVDGSDGVGGLVRASGSFLGEGGMGAHTIARLEMALSVGCYSMGV